VTRPKLAFVADDFTGATDTLATVAKAGLRARLYLRVDELLKDRHSDVVGIATATRSLHPEEMTKLLRPIGQALEKLAVPVVHYKICSTFDSAPHVGSIGAAVSALRPFVASSFLPIVGGQPSLRRYCLFGNLFAGAGANSAVHRIDRHPTMSHHPITPMREADLCKHLAGQGLVGVRSIDFTCYERPLEADGEVLFDVASHADLALVGRQIWQRARRARLLAVGSSSVAQALIEAWKEEGSLPAVTDASRIEPARGPVFVLSGSQSPVTAEQIQATSAYEKVQIDLATSQTTRRCVQLLRSGRHVLAHTGRAVEGSDGVAIAAACARLLASVLDEVPLSRVVVCGGDTSSHAIQAIGIDSLEYAAELAPGAALCRVRGTRLDGLELMLKGGQMGPPDIFDRLISP
jgi:3-oxoisoapionate kinase